MLAPGVRIVRGPDWTWGNQDGGEGYLGTVCEIGKTGAVGSPDKTVVVQWDNGTRTNYRVGYNGKYDLRVIDNAQIGKVGRVLDIRGWDIESSRSVANVTWFSGSTNVYRLGHKGNCDIKYIEPASGGFYYPEHLPILGQNIEQNLVRPARSGPPPFSVGDKVKVTVTVDQLKAMQQGHGGWNPRMAEYIGKVGTVHRVTDKGDIRVQYEGCNNRWTFNPMTLCKVNSFAVGDIVSVIADVEKVKELQKGHGEWIDIMKNSLGKLGKIVKVYADGDLRVQLDGHAWTLNPQCVKIVPGSAAELANTMHATQNQRQEPSMQWHPANPANNQTNGTADQLVRAAAQGQLESVKRILEDLVPNMVDARSGGKTPLQVAAHQGHVAIVRELLSKGADVNASDNDGDTCLHYAAFGNQPEVVDLLIVAGASLNTSNRSGCTALHIAAHKHPSRSVQILLTAGADPNCRDAYGDTALHDAIGKDNYQVIDLLCSASGTDFTLRNKRGFNVLHHAALKGKDSATKKLLSKARQLVDVKKDDGFSALHLAALNGHKDVVDTLVRIGQADIDLRNNRNQSALLLAVSQGHCGVIELLVKLKANINAKDEDGDTALHITLIKRSQFTSDVREQDSPGIWAIHQNLNDVNEHRIALSIACYLIQMGIDIDSLNAKSQSALSLLQESTLQELLKSYKPIVDNNQAQIAIDNMGLDALTVNDTRNVNQSYNLTERNSPRNFDEVNNQRRSRREQNNEMVECQVCSDLSEENVRLEPCNHKPACEDCSSRMKKCLQCGAVVQKRITKDGRIIPAKSRQPSAERMRYLECKIAEIEESHACSICMERKRNVVFLCGHGTCSKCADTLKTCHMCRKTITKKIPIY
ncbi:zinc finger c3hc4 type (ring finger) [Holotrichia oblita]|uniref:Zinc finger c3hc4 type (Ring finger) n=1 Tax=Holotrichia oblita TaxID=644536 RepID=A0ACB9TEH3_HOLOL|nr:zinc finger c3hc4 type (ring finger) [Holotrichia oblita]